jgi:adenylate kinase family enzyme
MDTKKKPVCILVMGGPASGKGTYCKKLAEEYGMIHVSIGDVLREERQKNTEQGRFLDFHMKEFERTGKLMPSEVVAQFLYLAIVQNGWDKNVYLIDGFIKAKGGYDCWQKMFSKIVDLKFVMYLECKEETMLKRLMNRSETSHRIDDNENIFMTRIKTFYERTYPCIELFALEGKVKKINTEDFMENVYAQIKGAFLEYFPDFNYY